MRERDRVGRERERARTRKWTDGKDNIIIMTYVHFKLLKRHKNC